MANRGRARERRTLPPPLPPETRTIGQLVAETIRLYGRRFWPSLALGIVPALLFVASTEWRSGWPLGVLVVAAACVNSAVYCAACAIAAGRRPDVEALVQGFFVGVVVWLPAFFIPVVWFAVFGLSVPAALLERRRGLGALRRGYELFRADWTHALGAVLALVVTTFVVGAVLFVLIRSGSQQGVRIAAGLSSLVLTPIVYLGAALLYFDQAARAVSSGHHVRAGLKSGARSRD